MKRALVLSGGGSRGAYEVGAWRALEELGVRFQAVYGASVGAINAALVAQGDRALAEKLWDEIDLKQILATDDEDFAIDSMISRKRDVIPFLVENAKHLRVDTKPLEELIHRHLNESAVRASGMELGMMTVRAPQMQPVGIHLSEMRPGMLGDWILASASCFPVFPARKIDGERYLDGGYFDNLPIDMAIRDGADEIVAIDLHPEPAHPEYGRMPFLRMIHPLHNLGGFLDFNHRLLRRMQRMGYYDTMKSYGAFEGIRYTFTIQPELHTAARARTYMQRVARFDAEVIHRVALRMSQPLNAPLISAIEAETPLRSLSWKEVWLRGLELCARVMDFRDDAIYDPAELTGRILKFVRQISAEETLTERALQRRAQQGDRELLGCLYQALLSWETLPAETLHVLADYPAHTAAALYLVTAEGK